MIWKHTRIRFSSQVRNACKVHLFSHTLTTYRLLSLDSKRLVDELELPKQTLDPLIRCHPCVVSENVGVSIVTLSSTTDGPASAHRGTGNEEVCQRDAVIDYESCTRARGKVILEKLKGASDALHVEFMLLLAPKPSGHMSENVDQDVIKETESYLSSISWEDFRDDAIIDCHCG